MEKELYSCIVCGVLLEKLCFTVKLCVLYRINFILSTQIRTRSSFNGKKNSKISSEERALAY